MTLHVLGSNSQGNCYLLTDKQGQTLVIEAGIKYEHISRKLDFHDEGIVGAIVSHCHSDHAKYVSHLLQAGVDTYGHESIFTAKEKRNPFAHSTSEHEEWRCNIGNFHVKFLPVEHDVPCFAFFIRHYEGNIFFVTDTMYCGHDRTTYILPDCLLAMLECNYDDDTLNYNVENGTTEAGMVPRLKLSHMELATTKEILKTEHKVKNLLLIHLSGRNSDPDRYVSEIQSETAIPTYIARKGLELKL